MRMIRTGAILALSAIAAAQPALAGSPADEVGGGMGVFAGARMRIDLGAARRERATAALTLAPARASVSDDGVLRTRYGEGLEFGFVGKPAPSFRLAGRPLDLDGKRNASSAGTAALVVGGLLLAGGIAVLVVTHEVRKNSD